MLRRGDGEAGNEDLIKARQLYLAASGPPAGAASPSWYGIDNLLCASKRGAAVKRAANLWQLDRDQATEVVAVRERALLQDQRAIVPLVAPLRGNGST